jgi:hypothetical protein
MKVLLLSLLFFFAAWLTWNKYEDRIRGYFYPLPSATPSATPSVTPSATPSVWNPPTQFNGTHSDFTTVDGEITKNATIKRVEADGIVVLYEDGIKKLHFKDLPAPVAQKYGYDPLAAQRFIENQNRSLALSQSNYIAHFEAIAKATPQYTPPQIQPSQNTSVVKLPTTFTIFKKEVKQVRGHNNYISEGQPITVSETITILRKEADGLYVRGEAQNTYTMRINELPENIRRLYFGY